MSDEQETCEHEYTFQDDSFDHEFGTEVIKYYECEKCGKTISVEEYKREELDL